MQGERSADKEYNPHMTQPPVSRERGREKDRPVRAWSDGLGVLCQGVRRRLGFVGGCHV